MRGKFNGLEDNNSEEQNVEPIQDFRILNIGSICFSCDTTQGGKRIYIPNPKNVIMETTYEAQPFLGPCSRKHQITFECEKLEIV